VSDDRFDRIATFERATQCPSHAALLTRNVHAEVLDAVATVTAIDKAVFRFYACELFDLV
jgi:hypothetical protein